MKWSQYQLNIFDAAENDHDHLLIEAVPGSGKTTTAIEVARRAPSDLTVLYTAFNTAIAEEVTDKLGDAPNVEVRTLHALGRRAITRYDRTIDFDEHKTWKLISNWATAHPFTHDQKVQLRKLVSLAKNLLVRDTSGLADLIDHFAIDTSPYPPVEFASFADTILSACARDLSTVDYDDMVWLPHELSLTPPTWDVVLLDEAQDINPAQLSLVKKALHKGSKLIAFGDRHQAIYGFRGADLLIMPKLIEAFSMRALPLSISYRCPNAVVRLAGTIYPGITASDDANEGAVCEATLGALLRHKAVLDGDVIISRTNAPLASICMRLLRQRRKARILGRDTGSALVSLIRRTQARTVPELASWLSRYEEKETKRLEERGVSTEIVRDRVATIISLSDGLWSTEDLVTRIVDLFGDDEGEGIILSTTHKAKGLEWDRVWLLRDTYSSSHLEERNLLYVGITRARDTLMLVR